MTEERFIPCTREVEFAPGLVYRPIRSWHSGTYAGERLTAVRGDGSGCMSVVDGRPVTSIPYTVTHRLYWKKGYPERTISAFLSYPGGMGHSAGYFWEAFGDGIEERFDSEEDMERAVAAAISGWVY
jgi:hypothetical protein